MRKFVYALSEHRLQFLGVMMFGIALNAVFAVADPLITRLLIDEGLINRNFRLFALFAVTVVLFGVFVRIGFWAYDLLSQKLKNRITETLTLRMLKSYFNTTYRDVAEDSSGYFLSRIYDEPSKVALGIVGTLIALFISIVTFLGSFAVSLYLAWRITLILSVVVPLLYYLSRRFSPRITEASRSENEEEARLREVLGKAVESYQTVRIFNLYDSVQGRVLNQVKVFLGFLYSRVKASKNFQTLSGICLSLAEAAVLIAAGYEVVGGNLTIGGLFGFMSAFWKLIGAANGIIALVPELSKLKGYIERLREFESRAKPDEEGDNQCIELDNVSVRYNGTDILKGFTLKIGDNEKVLIVGPNGSGKTTLAYVMTRFLKPYQGTAKTPTLNRVSALLAPFHFAPGTLKDNVNYDSLSEEKKQLFGDLVDQFGLRDKLDCEVSSDLSEGEKKKSQIVMTLLKDADVYIFDEPLANIDAESKDEIIRRKFEHTKGKTVISIMHGDEKFHSLFERIVRLK